MHVSDLNEALLIHYYKRNFLRDTNLNHTSQHNLKFTLSLDGSPFQTAQDGRADGRGWWHLRPSNGDPNFGQEGPNASPLASARYSVPGAVAASRQRHARRRGYF